MYLIMIWDRSLQWLKKIYNTERRKTTPINSQIVVLYMKVVSTVLSGFVDVAV